MGADCSKGMEPLERGSARVKVRTTKAGRWRAVVLIAVQLAIAAHIAHWITQGRTLTPLEPSESMQFTQSGVINAGFVFFALAIASTLVLGRWFCGWACHVVALQDFCRWLLGRAGIKVRRVDLGILAMVPWLAFLYMFVSPLLLPWLQDAPAFEYRGTEFTTDEFWQTFPAWPVALATLFVCGFAMVYLLGAKGFCTYGCPYGGIFGIADQLAPLRIRVTDACSHCGQCTAVCTSNVNVSQEVRDHGAVVDPGCMKCMDCVSVCPTDALYVGWGKPALFTGRRTPEVPRKRVGPGWARLALTFAFPLVVMLVLHAHDGRYGANTNGAVWALSGALALIAGGVALVFRSKARPPSEHSFAEELCLAVAFAAALWSFRGLHGWVPLLFAMGLASVLAWLAVSGLRLFTRKELAWKRLRLKASGKLTPAGLAFAAVAGLVGVGWAAAAHEQRELVQATQSARAAAQSAFAAGIARAQAQDFAGAERELARAVEMDPFHHDARRALAQTLCLNGRPAEGLEQYERVLGSHEDAQTHVAAAIASQALDQPARSRAHLERAIVLDPQLDIAHELLAELLEMQGDREGAEAERKRVRKP